MSVKPTYLDPILDSLVGAGALRLQGVHQDREPLARRTEQSPCATPTSPCWQPMSTAPRDGSDFICVSGVHWLGGEKRRCDTQLHLCRMRRARSAPDSLGYWLNSVHEFSIPDNHISHGYWTTVPEWDAYLPSLAPWREAPLTDLVVFLTEASYGHIEATVAWWREDWGGWASVHNSVRPMHPGYLDGRNTGHPPMRWAPMADLWPRALLDIPVEK